MMYFQIYMSFFHLYFDLVLVYSISSVETRVTGAAARNFIQALLMFYTKYTRTYNHYRSEREIEKKEREKKRRREL